MKIQLILISLLILTTQITANVITYVCKYTHVSDRSGLKEAEDSFILTFIKNNDTDECYMLGDLGTTKVIPVLKGKQITFIEITEAGNVMTTTIDSELGTVHSRNTVLLGKIIPSQYYGTCTIK